MAGRAGEERKGATWRARRLSHPFSPIYAILPDLNPNAVLWSVVRGTDAVEAHLRSLTRLSVGASLECTLTAAA